MDKSMVVMVSDRTDLPQKEPNNKIWIGSKRVTATGARNPGPKQKSTGEAASVRRRRNNAEIREPGSRERRKKGGQRRDEK